ncbi:MAG TPA: hypothetical protein VNG53_01340 [Bacteroidia bacterium]|nr:hypothetical protein [Bacteroidia bacterium]
MKNIKTIMVSIVTLFFAITALCQQQFNPYIPQVPVNDYRNAELYKQNIYDQRRQYISEQNDRLTDLLQTIYSIDTIIGKKWIDDFNSWATKYTDPRNYDITNIDVYDYIANTYRTWIRESKKQIKSLTDKQ